MGLSVNWRKENAQAFELKGRSSNVPTCCAVMTLRHGAELHCRIMRVVTVDEFGKNWTLNCWSGLFPAPGKNMGRQSRRVALLYAWSTQIDVFGHG